MGKQVLIQEACQDALVHLQSELESSGSGQVDSRCESELTASKAASTTVASDGTEDIRSDNCQILGCTLDEEVLKVYRALGSHYLRAGLYKTRKQKRNASPGLDPSGRKVLLQKLISIPDVGSIPKQDALAKSLAEYFQRLVPDAVDDAGYVDAHAFLRGLPPHAPVQPFLEVFQVGAEDPREALRGQRGVRVRGGCDGVEAYTFLGFYGGTCRLYHDNQAKLDQLLARDALRLDSYAADLKVPLKMANKFEMYRIPQCAHVPLPMNIVVSGAESGNELRLLNDPVVNPEPQAYLKRIAPGAGNCHLYPLLIGPLPFLAVFTQRRIAAGEECCYLYGEGYWQSMASWKAGIQREERARREGEAAAARRLEGPSSRPFPSHPGDLPSSRAPPAPGHPTPPPTAAQQRSGQGLPASPGGRTGDAPAGSTAAVRLSSVESGALRPSARRLGIPPAADSSKRQCVPLLTPGTEGEGGLLPTTPTHRTTCCGAQHVPCRHGYASPTLKHSSAAPGPALAVEGGRAGDAQEGEPHGGGQRERSMGQHPLQRQWRRQRAQRGGLSRSGTSSMTPALLGVPQETDEAGRPPAGVPSGCMHRSGVGAAARRPVPQQQGGECSIPSPSPASPEANPQGTPFHCAGSVLSSGKIRSRIRSSRGKPKCLPARSPVAHADLQQGLARRRLPFNDVTEGCTQDGSWGIAAGAGAIGADGVGGSAGEGGSGHLRHSQRDQGHPRVGSAAAPAPAVLDVTRSQKEAQRVRKRGREAVAHGRHGCEEGGSTASVRVKKLNPGPGVRPAATCKQEPVGRSPLRQPAPGTGPPPDPYRASGARAPHPSAAAPCVRSPTKPLRQQTLPDVLRSPATAGAGPGGGPLRRAGRPAHAAQQEGTAAGAAQTPTFPAAHATACDGEHLPPQRSCAAAGEAVAAVAGAGTKSVQGVPLAWERLGRLGRGGNLPTRRSDLVVTAVEAEDGRGRGGGTAAGGSLSGGGVSRAAPLPPGTLERGQGWEGVAVGRVVCWVECGGAVCRGEIEAVDGQGLFSRSLRVRGREAPLLLGKGRRVRGESGLWGEGDWGVLKPPRITLPSQALLHDQYCRTAPSTQLLDSPPPLALAAADEEQGACEREHQEEKGEEVGRWRLPQHGHQRHQRQLQEELAAHSQSPPPPPCRALLQEMGASPPSSPPVQPLSEGDQLPHQHGPSPPSPSPPTPPWSPLSQQPPAASQGHVSGRRRRQWGAPPSPLAHAREGGLAGKKGRVTPQRLTPPLPGSSPPAGSNQGGRAPADQGAHQRGTAVQQAVQPAGSPPPRHWEDEAWDRAGRGGTPAAQPGTHPAGCSHPSPPAFASSNPLPLLVGPRDLPALPAGPAGGGAAGQRSGGGPSMAGRGGHGGQQQKRHAFHAAAPGGQPGLPGVSPAAPPGAAHRLTARAGRSQPPARGTPAAAAAGRGDPLLLPREQHPVPCAAAAGGTPGSTLVAGPPGGSAPPSGRGLVAGGGGPASWQRAPPEVGSSPRSEGGVKEEGGGGEEPPAVGGGEVIDLTGGACGSCVRVIGRPEGPLFVDLTASE